MNDIILWSEMAEFLNGFVLKDIIFKENFIVSVNSNNEFFNLAKKVGLKWIPLDGIAYEAVYQILQFSEERYKQNKNFSEESRREEISLAFKEFIGLHNKNYKN